MMRLYVIRQGDYLLKLSHTMGFDPNEAWNAEKNRALRNLRSPDILSPSDVIYIEPIARRSSNVTPGETNRFVSQVPQTTIRLLVNGRNGPLRQEKCNVSGIGPDSIEIFTDESGMIVFDVPLWAQEVRLAFFEDRLVFPVLIGHLNPATELSGVRVRLAHLGYYPLLHAQHSTGDWNEPRLVRAIREFQWSESLEATGVVCDQTRAALVHRHGS